MIANRLLLILGLSATVAGGADWPMFRGNPALTGVAPGKLPESLALLWRCETGGPVKSSAAIVGDRVFIGSHDANLYALDLATGRKLWTAATGDEVESSPLVREGRVFVGSADGFLYAFDADTGKRLWRYETANGFLAWPNWASSSQGNAT